MDLQPAPPHSRQREPSLAQRRCARLTPTGGGAAPPDVESRPQLTHARILASHSSLILPTRRRSTLRRRLAAVEAWRAAVPRQVFKAGLTDARKAVQARKEDADKTARVDGCYKKNLN